MATPENPGDDITNYLHRLGRGFGTPDEPIAAGSEADMSAEAVNPPVVEVLDILMQVVDSSRGAAFGGLFAAIAKDELRAAPVEDMDGLAAYDAPATEEGKLQFDQDLTAVQYQQTLRATGLRFGDSVFVPQLTIADGEQFASTLVSIQQGSDTLRAGLSDIVAGVLIGVSMAHVPSFSDEEAYARCHLHPKLQPEVADDPQAAETYYQTTTQTLLHARTIAAELERLGASQKVVADLRRAHEAELEGMLPEWAVAAHWGLYRPPTTYALEYLWTQWATPEEWQGLCDFMDNAAAKAPAGSKFVRGLAATILSGVQNLRNGVFVPTERPPSVSTYDDDDYDFIDFDLPDTPERRAEREAYERQYDAMLADVEQRLQQHLGQ